MLKRLGFFGYKKSKIKNKSKIENQKFKKSTKLKLI